MNNMSKHPCPICGQIVIIIGKDSKNRSIAACGHAFKFKKTKSQKMMDKKYVTTEWGLQKIGD